MNTLETAVRKVKRGLGLSSDSPLVRGVRPAYDALLRAVYQDKGLARSFHGEPPLFLRPECRAYSEEGDEASSEALKRLAQKGGVVLDVGANVGVYSMLCARWAGPEGRVFAFEPAPATLVLLRDHLQMNGLTERVEVVPQAASDEVGEAVFYTHDFSGENSLSAGFAERVPEAATVRVPMTTLDAFCQAHEIAPTLIKIDVEGYELQVLRGARETIRRYQPALLVEMHTHLWPEINVSREEFAAFFDDLPYTLTPLEGQDPLHEFGHILLERKR